MRQQLHLRRYQPNLSRATKIFEYIHGHVGELGNTLGFAELTEQAQFGPVLPPRGVFDGAAILAILVELTVISEELINSFRHSPLRDRDAVISRRPAPFIEFSNQFREPAKSRLAARGSEGLPDAFAMMEAVDMIRTPASVLPSLAAARPEELALFEVTPDWIGFAISIHLFTLPVGFAAESRPNRFVSHRSARRRWPKS